VHNVRKMNLSFISQFIGLLDRCVCFCSISLLTVRYRHGGFPYLFKLCCM